MDRTPHLLLLIASLLTSCGVKSPEGEFEAPVGMVVIPAGWFLMGEDDDRRSNRPQRRVYLDAYAIDLTEVTNAAFAAFITSTGYDAPGWDGSLTENGPDLPVVGVLWQDADAYCQWVGKRLPTEAEWEKAARGTDGRRYPWGNTWEQGLANTMESKHDGVLPVGSYPDGASSFGLFDMAGNAAEWISDYYDASYYTYAPDHNPGGPTQILDHGLRGGSWAAGMDQAQTFFRNSSHSAIPNGRVGFRCAIDVSPRL
jgi:formylglycine-generating enzyme required for sulfatase activity